MLNHEEEISGLRVLHLTTSFPRHAGDPSGVFVYRLVEGLRKAGNVCGVLTPASKGEPRFSSEADMVRFRYAPSKWQGLAQDPGGIPVTLKCNPLLYSLLPPFLLSFGLHILKCARDFDVIHAHWSICGALAVMTKRLHRKPVITTLRGSDVHRAGSNEAYKRIHRLAISGSCFTVGVSHGIVEALAKRTPELVNRFRFVPNGVDELFYAVSSHSRPDPLRQVKLLFAGSLIERKGLDLLLKALGSIQTIDTWALTVAGDGPELDRLMRLSASLGISERISFVGSVSPERMPSLMADHHALVLPSRGEGRPNIILEAMAAALPVVATNIDGTGELVQNDRTGLLVPPNDYASLADAIASILRGPEDLERFGLAGRNWMRSQGLTWKETANGYGRLYHAAMGHRATMWPVSSGELSSITPIGQSRSLITGI